MSCGEDAMVKAWELGPLWRGAPHVDELEPYATLRGHTAPVLALAYRPQGRILFSAGMDCSIRAWHLPDARCYDAYGTNLTAQQKSLHAGLLVGHSDVVWNLQQHPHLAYLASASADGRIGLWCTESEHHGREASAMDAFLAIYRPGTGGDMGGLASGSPPSERAPLDVPVCVAWVPSDAARLLGGFASSRVVVFDVQRGARILELTPPAGGGSLPPGCGPAVGSRRGALGHEAAGSAGLPEGATARQPAVTSVCCHRIMQLVATGHVDGCARLIDLASGKFVGALSGDHAAAVTSVCMDPTRGHCLVTGCHDGYVRSFDLRNGRCSQRLWLHHTKYDEAVHCVHLTHRLLATAGADGTVAMLWTSD
eukprot:CAMPEP_0179168938 /NCGR_PEP_ID=MMETSP0796-20121207/83119_1 /TAXON_ID=73915 /ORGANISM="Pyrodinium bahamense, Strain pbaha01" /LENGTH=366 /DNA_ID=CAMNT_0020871727 /DNA_START=156 /DNA_END=1256 /DNA_ORIENTATION=-